MGIWHLPWHLAFGIYFTKVQSDNVKACVSGQGQSQGDILKLNNNKNKNKPMSAMDQILLQEQMRKQQEALKQKQVEQQAQAMALALANKAKAPVVPPPPEDAWLASGIIVKVLNKKVGAGKYYKKKGEVVRIEDDYVATVELRLSSGKVAKLKVDQDDLETVVPAIERKVKVLAGKHRGSVGVLKVGTGVGWYGMFSI